MRITAHSASDRTYRAVFRVTGTGFAALLLASYALTLNLLLLAAAAPAHAHTPGLVNGLCLSASGTPDAPGAPSALANGDAAGGNPQKAAACLEHCLAALAWPSPSNPSNLKRSPLCPHAGDPEARRAGGVPASLNPRPRAACRRLTPRHAAGLALSHRPTLAPAPAGPWRPR